MSDEIFSDKVSKLYVSTGPPFSTLAPKGEGGVNPKGEGWSEAKGGGWGKSNA